MSRFQWPLIQLIRSYQQFRRRAETPAQEENTRFSGPPVDVDGLYALPSRQLSDLNSVSPAQLFTMEALYQSWQVIRRAGGGAGVDGVTLQHFEQRLDGELTALQRELINGSYQPKHIRRVLVPKATTGLRPIAIWALRDRIAQRAVYELIDPIFEATFLPCSFGFRPGRGVEDAVKQLLYYRDQHQRWVLDGDIRSCFENIDSQRLILMIKKQLRHPLLVRYLQRWLTAKILNSLDGGYQPAGTSQGGVLSPLFANIYLHTLDQELTRQKLSLIRYADDFVVCCRRRREAMDAQAIVAQSLQRLGLALHPQKTRVVHFDEGFVWLGHFFVRQNCYRL